MSVLIKGMEMPTNCENCRFWYQDQDSEHNVWSRCTALNHNEIITFRTMRRSDCPLVEVPAPHGRLIDADNLVSVIDDEFTEQTRTLSNPIEVLKKAVLCGFAKDVITAAPTIIEVEEGEEA